MEKVTTEDPLLSTPAQRAEATRIYEQAERAISIRWGRRLAKYRAESIELVLAGGVIGSLFTFVITTAVFMAL